MIYKTILKIRNKAFDKGWKKSFESPVPTICIGNLTVGGTGKTPHTEMILRTLLRSDDWAYSNLAVLSRGYKRKSRGFQKLSMESSAREFGDEPSQIARKFPIATVAVDKDRVEGCKLLADGGADFPPAQIILLDDAFQYRRLRATYNILLVDYNRPIFKDKLLPWGRLRDLPSRIADAQMVIVTKCPVYMDDEEKARWAQSLGIKETQKLLFTSVSYQSMEPVYPEKADSRFTYAQRVILFTGIANDTPLRSYLSDKYKIVKRFSFPDHHQYTASDIQSLLKAVKAWPTACIATTEKDARRIVDFKKIPDELKERLFQVPIEVSFLSEAEKQTFEDTLLGVLHEYVK